MVYLNRLISTAWQRVPRATLFATFGLLLTLLSGAAHAVLLTYQGNNFTSVSAQGTPPDLYTTSDSVRVTLDLPTVLGANLTLAAITPTAFLFEDGVQQIDQSTATSSLFLFSTDAMGAITAWSVLAQVSSSGLNLIVSDSRPSFGGDRGQVIQARPDFYSQSAIVELNPGTWRYVTAVSEPSTMLLLLGGLLGLVCIRNRLALPMRTN
ncbi:MAG: hypothetical protein AAF513_17435 [Pseudomonadota bacterium]